MRVSCKWYKSPFELMYASPEVVPIKMFPYLSSAKLLIDDEESPSL